MKFTDKMRQVGRETTEYKNLPGEKDMMKTTQRGTEGFHPHAKGMDLRPGLNYAHRHK